MELFWKITLGIQAVIVALLIRWYHTADEDLSRSLSGGLMWIITYIFLILDVIVLLVRHIAWK